MRYSQERAFTVERQSKHNTIKRPGERRVFIFSKAYWSDLFLLKMCYI